jgi:large conductance mechanosensitive channel
VDSFVNDLLMPPLGVLIGGIDFSRWEIPLYKSSVIYIGLFLNAVVQFVIVAFAVFMLVKAINRIKKSKESQQEIAAVTPEEIVLLREIRDSLRKHS